MKQDSSPCQPEVAAMSEEVGKSGQRTAIGRRLAEERLRLSRTQQELADQVGTSKRSLIAWEAGDAMPAADSLAALDASGVDVLYVVAGKRGGADAGEASDVISKYMRLSPKARDAIDRIVEAFDELDPARKRAPGAKPQDDPQHGGPTVTFLGPVGQHVSGDNQGARVSMNITHQVRRRRKPG